MPVVDIDKIKVGSKFRDNIVTKIQEEVKDLKNGKVKVRKLISLDDGMIVIEDALYDFEQIVGEYKELQYNEIAFPDMSPVAKKTKKKKKTKKEIGRNVNSPPDRGGDNDDEEERRREVEVANRRAAEEKDRLEAEEKRREAEEAARRAAEEKERLEAEEKIRRDEEEAARREAEDRARQEAREQARREAEEKARQEERKRREAIAELRKKEAEKAQKIKQLRDNWTPQRMWAYTLHNDDKGENPRASWKLPPGTENKYDTKRWPAKEVIIYPPNRPLTSSAKATPHGYWCYGDPSLQPSSEDTEWIPRQNCSDAPFSVFLPGQSPPRERNLLVGEWCMENPGVWPPPRQPRAYTVHPPKTNPSRVVEIGQDKDVGVWRVGDDFPDVAEDDWNLTNVLVYEAGHDPEVDVSKKRQGLWGVAPSAQPNEHGVYNPDETWFILPGEKVPGDDEWEYRGTWVLDDNDDEDWPPYKEAPTTTTVYHQDIVDNVNERSSDSHEEKAIWIMQPDVEASQWIPQKVLAYKKGRIPDGIDSSTPQGLWGRAPDAEPDANGYYSPQDVWYVFPGEDAPNDDEWNCQGTWVLDSNENWPPYKDSPPQPQKFNVCHNSQLNCGSGDPGNAIWRIGNGYPDIDDDNWELAPVLAYEFGEEPENLKDKRNGLWGRALDAEPDENGNYNPNDMWFIYPGDTPPETSEWDCCGNWVLDDTAGSSPQWPPYRQPSQRPDGPILATIFPAKKALKECTEKGKSKGMWKYTAGKKVMDAGKQPREVLLHADGQELDEKVVKQGGAWGYAPGAKPDFDGNYSPCDLWCFASGESPPSDDEWQYQGIWIPKQLPKQQKPKLPSNHSHTSNHSQNSQNTLTGERKNTRVRRYSHSAWVYPSQENAPSGETGNLQGVWSTPPGREPGGKTGVNYSDGEPMEVVIHKRGKEPSESDLKKTASGKWGYAKDALPNSRGVIDPKDIIFFPPGVDCDPGVNEEGLWSCPGARIEQTISWRFEGSDIKHFKKTEIFFMDTVTTFTAEFVKK